MDIEDAVLSDALIGVEGDAVGQCVGGNQYQVVSTRFEFWNPLDEENSDSADATCSKFDREGDFDVRRRPNRRDFFLVEHTMATTLDDVGLQIWHGALLLCDYVLSRPSEAQDKIVLELGCGIGLTALAAALAGALAVFATDHDEKTLQLTERNVQLNTRLLPNKGIAVKPRPLDWKLPVSNSFERWPREDQDQIDKLSVILAADVIYDPQLNEALFSSIENLCSNGSKTVLIALEKRYNFTLLELDVACPAYTHFRSWIEIVRQRGWTTDKIDTDDIPVCFSYKRSDDMEIWRLRSINNL